MVPTAEQICVLNIHHILMENESNVYEAGFYPYLETNKGLKKIIKMSYEKFDIKRSIMVIF